MVSKTTSLGHVFKQNVDFNSMVLEHAIGRLKGFENVYEGDNTLELQIREFICFSIDEIVVTKTNGMISLVSEVEVGRAYRDVEDARNPEAKTEMMRIKMVVNRHGQYYRSKAFRFCERTQALIHSDLHTGAVMVTHESTQVIDPEFAFYGPMGFDIGSFIGNLFLAYFSQDGHAKKENDRKAYKAWIIDTIANTWNLFYKKFTSLWDTHKNGPGEAYLHEIYNDAELWELVKEKYMTDLFHDSLGFAAVKMIRRIVGVAHVEDFESISDPVKRADCERRALEFAKNLMKKRRSFSTIADVISTA